MFQYTIPNPSLIWKPLDRITTHQGDISVDCRISNFPYHPWWCALRAKQGALASDGSTEWITEEQNTVQPTEKRESSKKKTSLH